MTSQESTLRIALWWMTETVCISVCGVILVMFSHFSSALSGVLIVCLIWFSLTQMHTGLDLEERVRRRANASALFAERRHFVGRLMLFYFAVLSVGAAAIAWQIYLRPRDLHGDFAPTVTLMGLAVFRVLCLQRRYLRLRSDELSLE